jgi:hypothetical protein
VVFPALVFESTRLSKPPMRAAIRRRSACAAAAVADDVESRQLAGDRGRDHFIHQLLMAIGVHRVALRQQVQHDLRPQSQ